MLGKFYISKINYLLFAIPFIILMHGCTSSSIVTSKDAKKDEPAKENKMTLAEHESKFNPADYDQDVEILQKAIVDERKNRPLIEIPKDTVIIVEEIVQGFRIQIFSSSGLEEANSMKIVASEKFSSDSVYIVFDAPIYKVRVGDFLNRYDANIRLSEFVEKGYRDAWIVPDRIVQRKFVRVPLNK